MKLSAAVHETSRRLSQTLKDIYEVDWEGVEELAVITEVRAGYVGVVSTVLCTRCFYQAVLKEKQIKAVFIFMNSCPPVNLSFTY